MQVLSATFGMKDALGGTLRQCLCVKESLDFNNTAYVDLGELNWIWYNDRFECNTPISNMKKPSANSSPIKGLTTKYKIIDANNLGNKRIAVNTSGELRALDSDYNGSTSSFKQAMKGVLLAYEKASS